MSAPLDYAPAASKFSRRQIAAIAIVCIMIASALAAWRWWEPVNSRLHYLQLQRQCMNYTAPADQVTFTTELQEATRLVAIGGEYHDVYVPAHFDEVAGF